MGEEGLEALGKPPGGTQRSATGGQERFFFLFGRGERLPLHDQQQQAGCNYCLYYWFDKYFKIPTDLDVFFFSEMFVLLV
jgi:hypothetical protein